MRKHCSYVKISAEFNYSSKPGKGECLEDNFQYFEYYILLFTGIVATDFDFVSFFSFQGKVIVILCLCIYIFVGRIVSG